LVDKNSLRDGSDIYIRKGDCMSRKKGYSQRFREIGVVGREGLREILEETELGTDLGEGFTG
jgi:hypothetical protein